MLGFDNYIVYFNKTDHGCTVWNENNFANKTMYFLWTIFVIFILFYRQKLSFFANKTIILL